MSDTVFGFIGLLMIIAFIIWKKKKKKAEKKEEPKPFEYRPVVETSYAKSESYSYLDTKIAGVSYCQPALKMAYKKYEEEGYIDADIEEYEYKGERAFRVLCFDKEIGSIPRFSVDKVAEIYDRIFDVNVDIEEFETDEGETMLRADVSIKYKN